MQSADDTQSGIMSITIELMVGQRPLKLELPIPSGPSTAYDMLPVFRTISDSFVEIAVLNAEDAGKTVSCCNGCAACCRQLVPISTIEARRLSDLVESMPDHRRVEISRRFESAVSHLDSVGLLPRLAGLTDGDRDGRIAAGIDYFREGIACPFLEDESCSIYPERPIACREYLVTTPAVNCAAPTPESIECVDVVGKVSNAVAALDVDAMKDSDGWVPLVLALQWAQTHPSRENPRPGPAILRDLFDHLAR